MTDTPTTPKQYCSVEDIKNLTGIKGTHWFKKETDPDTKLNELLTNWIELASGVIDKYTNTTFDTTNTPGPIKLACSLMVSNIVAFSQSRRDTPIIKKNDWSVEFAKADFFNDDIKEMLSDYIKTKVTSTNLQIYAVSGRTEDEV